MRKMRKLLVGLVVIGISAVAYAGSISLVYDGNMTPDPNSEITVEVYTDTPLFCMGACAVITGDANITDAMKEADCNQYGWDNGWNSDPYIDDANHFVCIGGVRWDADANGTVGYFKFRYNSGQVSVYIYDEWSDAFGWDGESCPDVPFSTDILTFGVEDQNDSMGQSLDEQSTDEIPVISSKLQPILMYCPADACSSSEQSSKAAYENLKSERTADDSGGQMMEMDSVITISSNITTNQIWTAGNVYHVVADVNVRALLVIEPGTVVYYGSNGVLRVNNGGTLISCGMPDNPIIYTSDSGEPYFGDYYCAILIEETASPSTKVNYSYIEFAEMGIIIKNNRLDTPIENNYFFYDVNGILEFGTKHTDILNNLFYYNYCSGIEVHMASQTGAADANSQILIENNTCDYYQDAGIYIHGVSNSGNAGTVMLLKNIVSESYQYGLHLMDTGEYVMAVVACTGYYNNTDNKNWDFEESNSVEAGSMPFVNGAGYFDICHLNQICPFINAGLEYIEQTHLIGMTTDVNGIPDSNKTDLGFHHPNWSFSNAPVADLDKNLIVDFKDFAFFAGQWRQTTTGGADLDGNGVVNSHDLSIFCDQWLDTLPLGITLSQESNIVSDVLELTLVNPSDDIDCYLLMDGQYFGTFLGGDIAIPTYEYRNGQHELKVIGADANNRVLIAPIINITVDNRLECLSAIGAYRYNQGYRLAGFYSPIDGSTISFTIKDMDESTIWTNSSSGNFDFNVPAGVLQSPYNELVIHEVAGGDQSNGSLLLEEYNDSITNEADSGSSGWKDWIKDITKEFRVSGDPNNVNARSLLIGVKQGYTIPGTDLGFKDWTYNRKDVWKEYLNTCKNKSLDPTICLFFNQATRANIQTALALSNVKSIMIISDGSREVGNVHRTAFEAWDGPYFSYLGRNWSGPGYEPLPEKYENGYSVCDQIGSFLARNKLYVFLDACKNGTSCMDPIIYDQICPEPNDNHYSIEEYDRTSDMANAFGIYRGTLENRLYMGWRGEAFKGVPLNRYNDFLHWIWYSVGSTGSWSHKRFDDAISYAATAEWGNRIPYQNFSWVGNTEIYFGQ